MEQLVSLNKNNKVNIIRNVTNPKTTDCVDFFHLNLKGSHPERHKNVSTTQKYIGVNYATAREAVETMALGYQPDRADMNDRLGDNASFYPSIFPWVIRVWECPRRRRSSIL